jgi:germination protein M
VEEESNMVSSIVNALTEFDTIQQVQLLVEGENVETLTYGTNIAGPLMRGDVNLESVDMNVDDSASRIQVFFESESSGCVVPVTRMVYSNPDIDTAVLELLKGPKETGLSPLIPKGTGLISVKQEAGVVTINVSQAFKEVIDVADGGQAAIKALMLTCAQFPDVKEVKLLVEGEPFTMEQETFLPVTQVNTEEEALMASTFEE